MILIDEWVYAAQSDGSWIGPYCVVEINASEYGTDYVIRCDAEGKDASRSDGECGVDWEYVYVPSNEARKA